MRRFGLLETVSTKLVVLTVSLILVGVPFAFIGVLRSGLVDLQTLTSFVDASFKAVALLVGAVWTLNRLYTTRADTPQLRVDADITCVPSSRFGDATSEQSLLIYRLDIVNTGKTLIEPFEQFVEIQAVTPTPGSVMYTGLSRWPLQGTHPGGPIEPGSWSAINNAISIPVTVQAVRVFINVVLGNKDGWTWHKTFDISS